MREPPYQVEVKPYGRALVELARRRADVLCLSGDLTRQTEVDLFQAEFPERFIHAGMAEANMMSMAGALARCGFVPFVHTFGVFATRRPLRPDRQLDRLPEPAGADHRVHAGRVDARRPQRTRPSTTWR